jgi:hypothetical protein
MILGQDKLRIGNEALFVGRILKTPIKGQKLEGLMGALGRRIKCCWVGYPRLAAH